MKHFRKNRASDNAKRLSRIRGDHQTCLSIAFFFFFGPIKGDSVAPSAVALLSFRLVSSANLGSYWVGTGSLQASISGWFLSSPGTTQQRDTHVRLIYFLFFQRRYNCVSNMLFRRAKTITKPSVTKSTFSSGHIQSLYLLIS